MSGEFIAFFPEQVEILIDFCADYVPFQPYWAEMETQLNHYLQQIQGEELLEEAVLEGQEDQMVIG
jgi:hypothetical protein